MAFRRRGGFRRTSFRRRRGFTRTRPSTEPQRWEVAWFDIVNTIGVDANTPVVTLNEMFKIAEHVGDETTFQGQTMANMTRFIEVGGVVFTAEVVPLVSPDPAVVSYARIHLSLVTLVINAAGQPSTWNPFGTQPPIATAFVTNEFEDQDYPLRCHWRKDWLMPVGEFNAGIVDGTNIFGQGHNVSRVVTTTRSLRLRRRIDDHQGLYFAVATQGSAVAASTLTYRFSGHFYYRVRL